MEKKDLENILLIIKDYKETDVELVKLNDKLKEIKEKKDFLIAKLDLLKKKEEELIHSLMQKYGEINYTEILDYVVNNT